MQGRAQTDSRKNSLSTRRVILILGIHMHPEAREYAEDAVLSSKKLEAALKKEIWTNRNARDVCRIGELFKTHPHDLFFSCNLDTNGNKIYYHTKRFSGNLDQCNFAAKDSEILRFVESTGMKVDSILDEWVYIPLAWQDSRQSENGGYHSKQKYLNFITMAGNGQLSDGCCIISPVHVKALEIIFSGQLAEQLRKTFAISFLYNDDDDQTLIKKNPLWGACCQIKGQHVRHKEEAMLYFKSQLYGYSPWKYTGEKETSEYALTMQHPGFAYAGCKESEALWLDVWKNMNAVHRETRKGRLGQDSPIHPLFVCLTWNEPVKRLRKKRVATNPPTRKS